MKFILTWNAFPRMTATLWAVVLLCFGQAKAQSGLYVHFPNDVAAATCNYADTTGWGQPLALALSNESVIVAYTDQLFLSLPDTCFKILRTWSVIDWNTFNPALPLVTIPNPPGLTGPIVAASGEAPPWTPSQMGGINYAGLWSATANGYQYVQIISNAEVMGTSGLFIHFPNDIFANSCTNDTAGWPEPVVLSLSNGPVGVAYSDQVFTSLPDTCLKIVRTWTIIDVNNFDPALPLVSVPNIAGMLGPTVSAPGTPNPWKPSNISGVNYGSFWSATANGYTYQQIIFAKNESSGMYIRFPADATVHSCNVNDTIGLPKPVVLPLSNEQVHVTYQDEILTSQSDACLKIERTWSIVDLNTFNPALPLVNVPNPVGLAGPTMSGPNAHAPWLPSWIAGVNYVNYWSATANGYQYKQVITFTPIECPKDTVLLTAPATCTANLDYTLDVEPGWGVFQTSGLPSGSAFPVGVTINEFQLLGTVIKCSFKVTVKELLPPVARCQSQLVVNIGADNAADCYDGGVSWVPTSAFDAGSSDNCGAVHLTIQRTGPYTDCINSLNPVNGHPVCDSNIDPFPDFPSEFEKAISELDSMKFYCCETGLVQQVILRAYQLDVDGSISLDLLGKPIVSSCLVTVEVAQSVCGDTIPSLSGFIKLDPDGDCITDVNQAGLPGVVVKMLDSAGDTLYASSTLQGYYAFADPVAGTSILEVLPPLPLWVICDNPAAISIPAGGQSYHNFSAHAVTECPILTVDLGTDLLRPCRTSNWYVSYCNIGGGEAQNAYVQITAAQPLILVGASQPFVLNGEVMTVQVGDVAVGDCGNFSITVETPCDSALIGDQLCIEAHIFPDTFCVPVVPQWSGAQIEASAVCDGDSVRFTLLNTGTAPTAKALDYVIIDDMVVMHTGQIPAGFVPGATAAKAVVAQGHAMRLRAEQEAGHPSAQSPSVAVEDCNGTTIPSLLLEFTNEDGSPFTDMECREVVASFDPNEKLAFPTGFSSQHLIEANTRLTYQINFQNTGTDTAFLIVLRDTLSPLLDPASLRMGVSSHPYEWTLNGKGNVEIRFKDIHLPDSTTNEPASHGFVQFSISQKPDNAIGSRIENRASIFFDLVNPVIQTNTVWHIVGKDFIGISGTNNPKELTALHIFPNPAVESAFLTLEGEKTVQVRLLDVFGRTVRNWSGKAPGISMQRNGLAAGVYFVEVNDGKSWQQAGKMVWK